MKFTLIPALLACLAAAPASAALDFTTTQGSEDACRAVAAQPSARTPQQQQAAVICRDIELARHVLTFVRDIDVGRPPNAELTLRLRSELLHVREELRGTRAILEHIKLRGKDDGLLLAPATWARDLNGDGKISTWERYMFAIPKRQHGPLTIGYASNEQAYYEREYRLDAQFRVDQSDVTWALGYHYFAEALVEMVLSYTIEGPAQMIVLVDPDAMVRAHQLLVQGFKSTELLRRQLLAEKGDAQEWIPNPKQKNSVFPLKLDQEDFRIWHELLQQIVPLFEGKTLLASQAKLGGWMGSMAKLCPQGQGLSVPAFFQNPPAQPLNWFGRPDFSAMCQPLDAQHPATGLFDLLAAYAQRSERDAGAGMTILRQLLWVN
jgi:hypothetical protein